MPKLRGSEEGKEVDKLESSEKKRIQRLLRKRRRNRIIGNFVAGILKVIYRSKGEKRALEKTLSKQEPESNHKEEEQIKFLFVPFQIQRSLRKRT